MRRVICGTADHLVHYLAAMGATLTLQSLSVTASRVYLPCVACELHASSALLRFSQPHRGAGLGRGSVWQRELGPAVPPRAAPPD